MAGPKKNMAQGWSLIRKEIQNLSTDIWDVNMLSLKLLSRKGAILLMALSPNRHRSQNLSLNRARKSILQN